MEHHAADELHVEMHHVPRHRLVAHEPGLATKAAGGVADGGKGFREDFVEDGLAFGEIFHGGQALFPGGGFGAQLLVGK